MGGVVGPHDIDRSVWANLDVCSLTTTGRFCIANPLRIVPGQPPIGGARKHNLSSPIIPSGKLCPGNVDVVTEGTGYVRISCDGVFIIVDGGGGPTDLAAVGQLHPPSVDFATKTSAVGGR